ncbi:hypothetical protein ANANG_G00001240 [Anguilla anguilla]|uniref:Uncharacterized protein n=1 Tax=Anguilla anguilla TaxID=7936 RepID=A0A9D3S5U1_ANGAN|nr:hypothetical protein ANANG_G00001240 [Anguilla anguilla]
MIGSTARAARAAPTSSHKPRPAPTSSRKPRPAPTNSHTPRAAPTSSNTPRAAPTSSNTHSSLAPSPFPHTFPQVPSQPVLPPAPCRAPAVSHLPVYASKEATPVIANVVSLASAPTGQPYVTANTALPGAVPTALIQARINGDASTQTDAMKLPAPPRRVLKNKALLCRPISQNKGTMCKPHQKSVESQTDEVHGQKILVLPVPVPVFIPVPMHLYSQYTPLPVGLPVPLRTAPDHDMAEEEEGERDKPISYGDQGSTYSGDLESEGLSTPRSWEEEPAPGTQRLGPSDQQDSPAPSATLPLLDLEADFPLESLEPESGKGLSVTLRHGGSRRPRDSFPPRKRPPEGALQQHILQATPAGTPANGSPETWEFSEHQRGEENSSVVLCSSS